MPNHFCQRFDQLVDVFHGEGEECPLTLQAKFCGVKGGVRLRGGDVSELSALPQSSLFKFFDVLCSDLELHPNDVCLDC